MKKLNQLFLIGCVAAVLAGCASVPSKFYTLNATAVRAEKPAGTFGVLVGPVTVPPSVDRPQMVLTTGPNRVELAEFNRWASPLADNITRVVVGNLGSQLGSLRVAATPIPGFGPAYQVAIQVDQFETFLGDSKLPGEARLSVVWTLRDPSGTPAGSGVFAWNEAAPGGDAEGLVAAHSRILEKLSASIAAAIQNAVTESKP